MYRTATEVAYTYDALGQLIRVNDPNDPTAGTSGTTWVYSYDRGGNILSKSYYIYTTGTPGTAIDTIAYSYTDSNWKDKLTAYDGQAITYDAIGNPLNDGTWTYTWEKGRQLKQMSKSGMTVEFKYNHNGLRTQKKVTSGSEVTTTEYTLHGKLVTHLTRGSDKLHFFYDAQSRPAMVDFNGAVYSYIHNLQSDVVGIVDNAGSLVVEYKYDAWGKPTLVRTLTTAYEALAELNPFRYRGYVWDEETELYYLRSRYYDAYKCRFVNEDLFAQLRGFNNIFSYARNSPAIFTDPNGTSIFNMQREIEYSEDLVVTLFSDAGIDMPQDYKSVTCYATGTEENNFTDGYIEVKYRQEEPMDDGLTMVTTTLYKFEYNNHLPSDEAGGKFSSDVENALNALSFASQADPHPLAQTINFATSIASAVWGAISGIMFATGSWSYPLTQDCYWDLVYGQRITSYINFDTPQASSRQYKYETLIDGKWS